MQNDSGCCGEKWLVVRARGEEDPSWRPRECICLSVARSYCGLMPGLMMAHGDARLGLGRGALPNSSREPLQIRVQMYTRRKNSLIHFSEFLHTHTREPGPGRGLPQTTSYLWD